MEMLVVEWLMMEMWVGEWLIELLWLVELLSCWLDIFDN
jgi:hypothetical protein